MNKHKKHTTLTPEELVKLLDTTSNNELDFSELDSFEKEALEGFKANTSSSEVEKLIDHIQIDISKKTSHTIILNSNKYSTTKKNKIIWFSAAASLLLILTLSIFLINKTGIVSEQSIAINEPPKKLEPNNSSAEASVTLNSENDIPKKSDELKNDTQNIGIKKNKIKVDTRSLTFGNGASSPSNNPKASRAIIDNSAISTNNQNNKENKTQSYLSNPILKSEKFANDVEESSDSIILNEIDAKNTENIKNKAYLKKDATQIETSLSKNSEVAILDNDKLNTDVKVLQGASPSKASQNLQAYYTGGELAIKEYILDYSKKIKSTQKLKGKFIIKAQVLINGSLVVISIKPLGKDYANCMDYLKETLNTMKDWHSATKNGTSINSDVEFTLMF